MCIVDAWWTWKLLYNIFSPVVKTTCVRNRNLGTEKVATLQSQQGCSSVCNRKAPKIYNTCLETSGKEMISYNHVSTNQNCFLQKRTSSKIFFRNFIQ
jgi:hypothetical protein